MQRSKFVFTVLAGAVLLMSACSSGTTTQASGDSSTTAAPTTTVQEQGRKAPKRLPLDDVIDTAFTDIEDWWTDQMPEVYGIDYEPISGGFHPYSPKNPPVSCGGQKPTYEEFKDNAFYCAPDDLIMWDEASLIPNLYDEYGQFTVAFVFAHEWGHAIQNRSGMWKDVNSGKLPTITLEMQADCFAGAWARHIMDTEGPLQIAQKDLPLMIAGALEFADPVGVDAAREGAHGSGFDRLGSMEEGFNQGASRCAEYQDYPDKFPPVFETQFSSEEEYQNEGNLPYEDTLSYAVADLDQYWADLSAAVDSEWQPIDDVVGYAGDEGKYPKCGDERLTEEQAVGAVVYCPADNVVLYDDDFARTVHEKIGDMGLIVLFAHQWAVAFQAQNDVQGDELYIALQESCFTGTWAANAALGNGAALSLSPGDLDEALAAFLAFSEQPDEQGNTERGNAFQRVEAFRDGFLGGIQGDFTGEQICAQYTVADASDGSS